MFFTGCSFRTAQQVRIAENIVPVEKDEEYELLILDPGFESWFAAHARPIGFYSLTYYEAQNRKYVSSWNELFYRYEGRGPFENPINYDYTKEYGWELNYQLYWYFQYIESLYGNLYNFPS